jgi:DNA sulfur modification protein DndE
MKPPIENIRVTQKSRDTLIKLKRNTGIEHWNVLCRWAVCSSLVASTAPVRNKREPDSNIEMNWKTFGGDDADVLSALVLFRASKDGVSLSNQPALAEYFRAHLERGVSLIQNTKSLSGLLTA